MDPARPTTPSPREVPSITVLRSPVSVDRRELPKLHGGIAELEERGCRFSVLSPSGQVAEGVALENLVRTGQLAIEHGMLPEFTLRGENAHLSTEAIRRLSQQGLFAGAGTVVTADQASEVIRAGARFIVSPGLTPDTRAILQLSLNAGVVPVIGVGSAQESAALAQALSATPVRYAKLFPTTAETPESWKVMVMSALPWAFQSALKDIRFLPGARRVATYGAAYLIGSGRIKAQPLQLLTPAQNLAWVERASREFGLRFIATGGIRPAHIPALLKRPAIAGFGLSLAPNPAEAPAALDILLQATGSAKPGAVLQSAPCIHLTNGADGFPVATERSLITGTKVGCTALDNVRPPHLEKEFHRPPSGETHVLTVTEGVITITYQTAEGNRRFAIGDGCAVRSCVFEDHAQEGTNGAGHSSFAGPRGARAIIRIYNTGEAIFA